MNGPGLLGYDTLAFKEEDGNCRALTFSSFDNDVGFGSATIYITPKDDGSIHVSIIEEDVSATFVAYGVLTFSDGCVYVNNVKNGYLEDKYKDCFNLKPHAYIHLLNVDHLFNAATLEDPLPSPPSPLESIEEEEEE